VILFDFPADPAEYVRRVGRTARAGREGASTVFAYGWQLPIARSIIRSKLDSFTVALGGSDDEKDASVEEYRGGRAKRRKNKGDESIQKGIVEGKIWSDRKL
jgi:ATP-dependent RNA helicase DDX18/HAS1